MAFASLTLAGCAIVDQYSNRAIEFNLQAEKTQQQALLLNVIRASLRRPMQFTGLSSITGNATVSGGVTGGYAKTNQVPVNPTSATIASRIVAGTGTGAASVSGGQTFTVPVLDTQEFYQGILTPVSHQIIDYYVQQGFPPQLLFDLFVGSVEVIATDAPNCERFTFRNAVRNELQFGQFQALADYLLSSGFTTERVIESVPYGPAIASTREQLSASDAAKMMEAYSKASAAGLDIRSEGNSYRLQKRSSHFRFCFARSGIEKPAWLGALEDDAYCGHVAARRPPRSPNGQAPHCETAGGRSGVGEGGSSQFHGIKLSDLFMDRIRHVQQAAHAAGNRSHEDFFPTAKFRNKHVTFKFQTRSVEGILYYLGEITRQYLRPESGPSRLMQVKTGLRYGSYPSTECDSAENGGKREQKTDLVRLTGRRAHDDRSYACENLFVLENELLSNSFFSVEYDGIHYSVPNEPERTGRSLQVLELIKQLMALHTSAKQLPQSSVISIVGGAAQ
jgi:hypothetical protein